MKYYVLYCKVIIAGETPYVDVFYNWKLCFMTYVTCMVSCELCTQFAKTLLVLYSVRFMVYDTIGTIGFT